MKSRKGSWLIPDNTVELVVLVVIVAILVPSVAYAWRVISSDNESENAQHFLDDLLDKHETLGAEHKNTFVLQGFEGAEHWYLRSWSVSNPSRPEKCFFESCVCLCKGDSSLNGVLEFGAGAEHCQEKGFCRTLPDSFDISYKYPEVNTKLTRIGIQINPASAGSGILYDFVEVDCIPLSSKLFSITIDRTTPHSRFSSESDLTFYPLHCGSKGVVSHTS